MKQTSGSMKPTAITRSPIRPMTTGATAPPTIDIMSTDEAVFVSGPLMPAIAIEKMVGNMMLSNRYVAHSAITESLPTPAITRAMHTEAQSANSSTRRDGRKYFMTQVPSRRPMKKD